MTLRIATWNINSVRLRIDLVARFVAEHAPDVLCLQETKCPDDQFPLSGIKAMGFRYWVFVGQKGYNGVAIFSRFPLLDPEKRSFGGKEDARHIAAMLGEEAGAYAGLTVHNFYVPAGGDIPDRELNEKFGHKLDFLRDMRAWSTGSVGTRRKSVLVGDLNIAPYETDVWNHKALLKIVSHTPVETEALEDLRVSGQWIDAVRLIKPEPEQVYSWWSYRSADWETANKGRRLDHVWATEDLKAAVVDTSITKETRGWDKPSDHVPVTVSFRL
ncbi:MAG: exodeoxyribonuclease III [Beijerinckiaceae bacterium]